MFRIQAIAIITSILFLLYIVRLIIKGKLREEYSIVWIVCTIILIVFSFWRDGLAVVSDLVGVYSPPNLVFIAAIFAVFIYLLHLSVVISKLQSQNKQLAQDIALLKEKMK
ncbi:N/A [soil metagenome]